MITALYLRFFGVVVGLLGLASFFTPHAFFATLYDLKTPTVMEVNTLAFLGVNLVTISVLLFRAPASSLLAMLLFHAGCVANELMHPLSKPDMLNIGLTIVFSVWCILAIVMRPSARATSVKRN